jgi:hypothetical protein
MSRVLKEDIERKVNETIKYNKTPLIIVKIDPQYIGLNADTNWNWTSVLDGT